MEATNGSPQPGVRLGTRVGRVPSKPVEREADGRYALHLWLQHEGKFGGDLALRLSPAEAESLHAQLCYALDGEAATGARPGTGTGTGTGSRTLPCRAPDQYRTAAHAT